LDPEFALLSSISNEGVGGSFCENPFNPKACGLNFFPYSRPNIFVQRGEGEVWLGFLLIIQNKKGGTGCTLQDAGNRLKMTCPNSATKNSIRARVSMRQRNGKERAPRQVAPKKGASGKKSPTTDRLNQKGRGFFKGKETIPDHRLLWVCNWTPRSRKRFQESEKGTKN